MKIAEWLKQLPPFRIKGNNEQQIEESVDIIKIREQSDSLTPPTVIREGYYIFPYDADLIRTYEFYNADFIAIINSMLDLIFGTQPTFVGNDKEKAESIFDYNLLMKIAKELLVMGNAYLYVSWSEQKVTLIPTEYVWFKNDGTKWIPYIWTTNGVIEVDPSAFYHLKLTPMTVYPWGVPPAVTLIPLIQIKEKVYEAIKATTTLAKNPVYKVKTTKQILPQLKKLFTKWRDEGGINFIAVAEGMYDIEAVQPPRLDLERFVELVDMELFRNGPYPDPQFLRQVNKAASDTIFMTISMRAKRVLYVIEEAVNDILRKMGIDAELVHYFFPHERPTVDLFSLAQYVDMGVISPNEARAILMKAGLLPRGALVDLARISGAGADIVTNADLKSKEAVMLLVEGMIPPDANIRIVETDSEIIVILYDVTEVKQNTIRKKPISTPLGVYYKTAIHNETGAPVIMSIHFSKTRGWTKDDVASWLKAHGIIVWT